MENAHQRMGRLRFVRQKGDSITDVSVGLNHLIAENPQGGGNGAALHLVSVFGGDSEISAVMAAAQEGLRLQVQAPGLNLMGTLGENPVTFRASIQVPGRRRPVRHLIVMSQALYETSLGAEGEVRRTVLIDDAPEFVLRRLAARFGVPVLPEWAAWFHGELIRRGMVEELSGLNCAPIAVKGNRLRMMRLLSMGLRRGAISFPKA